MRATVTAACIALMLMTATCFAGDIVFCPTGNMVQKGKFEFNYIFWDFDNPPGAPENMSIYEFFAGLHERLEVDVDILDLDKFDTEGIVNIYVPVVLETPKRPSLIIGTYNLFANEFLPGDDDIAPFVLSSFNIHAPSGPPSFDDPLLRAHLGYGWGVHAEKPFGGLQMLFDPHFGGAILNHSGDPAYMVTITPCPEKHDWEISAGWLAGDNFYRVGWFHTW
jgi:hypothetical protein